MLTIHLHALEFFAYHGLYEDEKKVGNNFIVDVTVEIDADEKITALSQTVDYVILYEIIHKRMQRATKLLETVAQDLAEEMHLADNRIKSIAVTIKKLTPPIPNFRGSVSVSLKKTY
ncbi:MAG: dihydroneopterin aldolase [Ferruginibacter sp.]